MIAGSTRLPGSPIQPLTDSQLEARWVARMARRSGRAFAAWTIQSCAALLSGGLVAAAFPPVAQPWLLLVAFVPLLRAVEMRPVGRAIWLGWITGLTACGAAFHWILPTVVRFHELSSFQAALCFFGFVALNALPFALFAGGAALISWGVSVSLLAPLEMSGGWALASLWTFLEWFYPKLLPWQLGDAFASSPILRQSADLFGVYGLSYFIILVNGWLAAAIAADLPRPRRLRTAGSAVGLVGTVIVYGQMCFTFDSPLERPLTVAVIQKGPDGVSDFAQANEDAWVTYSRLTEDVVARQRARELNQSAAYDRVGLVIWPETALRADLAGNRLYRDRLEQLVNRLQIPLLVGGLSPADEDRERNSAFLFNLEPLEVQSFLLTRRLDKLQTYSKQRLVPFGEYTPGADWSDSLRALRTTGRFVPGEQINSLWLNKQVALAPSICFESLWPGFFLDYVVDGAGLLVNLSDDSWFDDDSEATLHLNAAILRAVEMRRWAVRASGSGISAIIDAHGNVIDALPLKATGALRRTVGIRSDLSLYAYVGNAVVVFAFANLIWFCLRIRSETYYVRKERERQLAAALWQIGPATRAIP